MKKNWTLTAALFVGLLVSPLSFAAKTINVTLQLPISHSLGKNWLAFKDQVEQNSKGSLQVQVFPSAQLFKDKQVPEAVGSGAIQAGSAFLGRFAGSVPSVEIVSLPFIFNSEEELRATTHPGSAMRTLIDDAILKETGARVLWWQAFGRNVYLSKQDIVIRTPKDLEGKKVRTYGKMQGWTVEALGGSPTLMSGSKQFLAYQQGAVEIGVTGVSAVKSRKLYDVMQNMTLSFDSAIEFVAIINEDFYQSLSSEEKQIINTAAKKVEQELRDHIYSEEQTTVADLEHKINIIKLTAQEREQWKQATHDVVARFRKENGESAARVLAALGR